MADPINPLTIIGGAFLGALAQWGFARLTAFKGADAKPAPAKDDEEEMNGSAAATLAELAATIPRYETLEQDVGRRISAIHGTLRAHESRLAALERRLPTT